VSQRERRKSMAIALGLERSLRGRKKACRAAW
jgi:hypothetical protein